VRGTFLRSATSLNNFAQGLPERGRHCERALTIREKALGSEHPATTTIETISRTYFPDRMTRAGICM
jgi:hypothetical protein